MDGLLDRVSGVRQLEQHSAFIFAGREGSSQHSYSLISRISNIETRSRKPYRLPWVLRVNLLEK